MTISIKYKITRIIISSYLYIQPNIIISSKKISYGLGGLGVVAMSALAFFGRFNWNWLWGLMGGLMLVGLYGTGVTAFTGETF